MFKIHRTRSIRVLWSTIAAAFAVLVLVGCQPVVGQELPPEILADRYLVQAEQQQRAGDYRAALATLDKILALEAEQDIEIPDIFWVNHAKVALGAGVPERAVESASRYLELVGQAGIEYSTALELIVDAEEEIARIAREEAARAAANDRERQEAHRRAAEANRRAALAREEAARAAAEANRRAALAREEAARAAAESARGRIGQGQRGVVSGILWGAAGGALYYFAEDLADWLSNGIEELEDPGNRDNAVLGAQILAGALGVVSAVGFVRGINNWASGSKALREAEEALGQASVDMGLSIGGKGHIGLVFAWRF